MLARLDVRDARTDLADRLGIGPHRGGPDTAVADSVAAIVEAVRERGDAAVREFTERFDGAALDRFRVTNDECRAAVEATPPEVRDALEVAASATTMGDLFTEVLHPATASHRRVDPAERARMGITDGTVRVSVGIEDPYDIVADIDRALERI